MITIHQITSLLESEGRNFETVVNNNSLFVSKLSFIGKAKENSLVYYTELDFEKFELKNCTLVCPKNTDTKKNNAINYILVDNPKICYYIAAQLLNTPFIPEIHHTAIIGENVSIKNNCKIGANVVIEDNVSIGENCNIHPNCVIYSHTTIDDNVTIEANSAIGATGVFWTWDENGNMWQLPQRGGVLIEKNCFLGSDISIVRACYDDDVTKIGAYTKIAHGTKIGHDTQIEQNCHLANNVSVGGKVVLNNRCFLGSGCTIKPSVELAEDTIVGAGSVVVKNCDKSKQTLIGIPAKPLDTKGKAPSGMNAPLHLVKKK